MAKQKLHDGYVVDIDKWRDGGVRFYDNPFLERDFRVNEDKILAYEGMCKHWRDNFMSEGLLRLHTPIFENEEILGTIFLYVPSKERARILELLEGEALVTEYGGNIVEHPEFLKLKPEGFKTFDRIKDVIHMFSDETREQLMLSGTADIRKPITIDELVASGKLHYDVSDFMESDFCFLPLDVEGMFVSK